MATASLGNTISRRGIIILSSVPILIFFYTFFQFVSNIPFQDDYDGLLEPVTKFAQLTHFSWSSLVEILWTQDDERRIVVDRIAAISVYLLNGHLDLRIQMFFGLLSLVGIFYLFYSIIRDAKLPIALLLSSALLLFTIQYYEAIFWAIIPFQQIVIYFLAFLSSYHLFSSKLKHFSLALLFAVGSILSDVNGTFILPVGVLLLLLQHRWKDTGIWVLLIGGIVLLYYHNLTIPAFRPKLSDNIQYPGLIFKNLLVFSGLSFDLSTVLPPWMRIGLIVTVGFILGIVVIYYGFVLVKSAFSGSVRNYPRWEITLWGGIIHLTITMLAFAVGRALDGTNAVLISRYKYIGFIWLIFVILLVSSKLDDKKNKLYSKVWLGLSFALFLFSYFQYVAPLDYYYKERYTDIYGWQRNRSIPSTPIYMNMRGPVDSVTVRAIRTGVYELPDHYFFDEPYEKATEKFQLAVEQVGGHTLVFTNDSYTRNIGKQDGAYIILKSEKQQHMLPTKQNRYSLKNFLFSLGKNYYANGFSATISNGFIQDNQVYTVYVLIIDGAKKQIYPTNYQLRSKVNSVDVVTL
ncbi:hypothetical protein [Spirosoma pollinicola]|uniref:Glycosyltransferase RgtA/B/C/D-like domain-containing protein n=1 Tax=Spirosoma pollinicola TaxID=2057025 RepID=A0A2K8Z298_9BACT|nr:hypothetical protein [Spirosoma pollinicola]AUD03954.1 hypothetical protein CWM47_20290 [Spirosoma pollinicola]